MKPLLIILSGLPFSGKSTIAQKLSDALDIPILSYDNDIYAYHKTSVPPRTSAAKEYDIIQSIAREQLQTLLIKGDSIIYDDLNLEKSDRQLLVELCRACKAQEIIVYADTPVAVIEQRRQDNLAINTRSHIDEATMQLDISLLQPPSDDEHAIYITPGKSVAEVVRQIHDRASNK